MKENTRQKIIKAFDELIYKNGYEYSSFKDIAEVVNISRGNFYHHFKTKDDILDAVISYRMEKTKGLLLSWDENSNSSIDSIKCFINILSTNKEKIMEYGCPVGTLVTELSKLNHHLKSRASDVFLLFKEWIEGHLLKIGISKVKSESIATHLLVRSQGVATIYNAFKDENILNDEINKIHQWLDNEIKGES